MRNLTCPCGSAAKYKRCCQLLHQGAPAISALQLMKARYSAYAVGDASYIMQTTHPLCGEYDADALRWSMNIATFHRNTEFCGLRILNFTDGETSASVTFHAALKQHGTDVSFAEESRFVREGNHWLYRSGKRL